MIQDKDKIEILKYSHCCNWRPDWEVAFDVYEKFSQSCSVLTPFAYSYLEELIRSTTHEYGKIAYDENNNIIQIRKVGFRLIELAIEENEANLEYINLLNNAKKYFGKSTEFDHGNNRNSSVHGYMHPRFWTQESFEELIHFIACISKYANF